MNFIHKKKKAFGIIEVLIGGMIIVSVLVAVVAIGRMSLRAAELNRQRAKATFLAQEGLEKLRLLRDTNWIDLDGETSWDSYGSGGSIISDIDVTNPVKYFFNAGTLTKGDNKEEIVLTDQTGLKFNRYITIEKTGDLLPEMSQDQTDNQTIREKQAFVATVKVEWENESTEIGEMFTNWRPNY